MKSVSTYLITLSLLFSMSVAAQQEFLTTHYMFNGLALNPAYAGVHDGVSASFLSRNQWVGFEGAPSTQVATIHSPLSGRPVSLGAALFRDQLGLSTEYGAYFSYAYRIPITKELKLSMGLQFSTHSFAVEYSQAENGVFDAGDNLGDISEFKWNVGSGALLHTDRLFVGFSVPQMLNKSVGVPNPDGNFSQLVRHYYLFAGYAFSLGRNMVLKPNVLVKSVGNAPAQIDLNANLLINSFLWVGASYRSKDSIDGILGFQITPQLLVSYATDFSLTDIDNQSHEIMINYIFELPTKKILTPRYF